MGDPKPTLDQIIDRHRHGNGWVGGKHWVEQAREDIAVLLDLILDREARLSEIVELADVPADAIVTGQEPIVLVAETDPGDDLEAWLG